MSDKILLSLEKQILLIRTANLLDDIHDLENKLNVCLFSAKLLREHPREYFFVQSTLKKLDHLLK